MWFNSGIVLALTLLLTGCDYLAGYGNAPALQQEKRRQTEMIRLIEYKRCVETFRAMEGRNPESLEDLESKVSLPPLGPGKRYEYDPQTGVLRVVQEE